MSGPGAQGDVNWGAGCRGLHGGAGVNNRSASLCQQLLTPPPPQLTEPTPPHVWKNPIQLIRFFKMDQFLISGASDYGQYHCRWEDSCWTAVFIYRNVCFLLYADVEAGNGELRPLHHCSPWPVQAGVRPHHACLQQHHHQRLQQQIQRSLIMPFGRSLLNIYSHQSRKVD